MDDQTGEVMKTGGGSAAKKERKIERGRDGRKKNRGRNQRLGRKEKERRKQFIRRKIEQSKTDNLQLDSTTNSDNIVLV